MTLDKTFVLICDWQGRLAWSSATEMKSQVGIYAWALLASGDEEQAKAAIARTVTLRENQTIEVRDQEDQLLRMWLWPMEPPESAICILCLRIPCELAILTARERDCLTLLSQGMSTKLIAAELDIGVSTVHTHLKHMREKLKLPRVEALISFAARFSYPHSEEG